MSIEEKYVSLEKQSRLPTSATQSQRIANETDAIFDDAEGVVVAAGRSAAIVGARFERHLLCIM
jgi:hypothetical protein